MTLADNIALAYIEAEVRGNRSGAVTSLREAISEDRAAARAELARLDTIVAARGLGCHVSRVSAELLRMALQPEA